MRTASSLLAATLFTITAVASAQPSPPEGPYKLLKTVKAGGDGGFDYVYADSDGRRLYIPRMGPSKRISVFDLDTLQPAGQTRCHPSLDVTGDGALKNSVPTSTSSSGLSATK